MPSSNEQIPMVHYNIPNASFIGRTIDVTIAYSTDEDEDFATIDSVIQKLISNVSNKRKFIGFDTWNRNSGSCDNPIVGIALSDGKTCLICQLWSFRSIPTSLANFLSLSTFTFAGAGLKFTLEKLERNYGLEMRNVVDMGPLVAEAIKKNDSAESLVCDTWDVHVLNDDQIAYVSNNACCYYYALLNKYGEIDFGYSKVYTSQRVQDYFSITGNLLTR